MCFHMDVFLNCTPKTTKLILSEINLYACFMLIFYVM